MKPGKLLCLVMTAVFAMTMTACGAAPKEAALDGKYSYDEFLDTLGWEMTFEFEGDKVTVSDVNDGEVTASHEGTYSVNGENITIKIDGANETGVISSDKSSITIDDGAEGTVYHKR